MYRQVHGGGGRKEGAEEEDHLTHLLTSRIVAEIDLGIVVSTVFGRTIPCDAFPYERIVRTYAYPTHTYFAKLV